MKGQDEKINKLQKLGFSKTKAMQALKDAGGDYNLSIKILNNQCASQKQQQQQQQQKKKKNTSQGESKVSMIPPTKPLPTHDKKEASIPNKKERLHPCIVQYKKCMFGERCLLRDFPGNTCINYFQGNCIYDSFCKKLHYIDGEDIRSLRDSYTNDGTMKLQTGEIIAITKDCGGHVYTAKAIKPVGTDGDKKALFTPVPPQSSYNLIAGSAPSYTDPNAGNWHVESIELSDLPHPFLDAIRQPTGNSGSTFPTRGVRTPPPHSLSHIEEEKHPCIKQFGFCKYGKECIHADRDANVCVMFLNNRCTRGANCPYFHESNADYLRRVRPDLWGAETLDENVTKSVEHALPVESSIPPPDPSLEGQESPEPLMLSSFVDKALGGGWDHDKYYDHMKENVCEEGYETWQTDLTDDKEMNALIGLIEVFPSLEPLLLLQSLRSAAGDVNGVVDMLSRLLSFNSAEEMDAYMWQERLAEEDSLQENETRSRNESLLTLCTLFPALETASIQAVLDNCHGDYADAYDTLLCSQENITRQDYGNFWRGNIKPADELRVSKLCKMFEFVPKTVVHNAFCASECDFAKTTTVLNWMTMESMPAADEAAETVKTVPSCQTASTSSPSHKGQRSARGEVPEHLLQCTPTREEMQHFRAEVEDELRELGDWRRVREQAYIVNACRVRVLSQASVAYLRGDGKTAKLLSRKGRQLGAEYVRLNRMAMVALEHERLTSQPTSVIDLHGFHTDEAVEVLRRRVQLCQRKKIRKLRIVVGFGKHSRRGYSTVYNMVYEQLEKDPQLKGIVKVDSVRQAYFDVVINSNGK